MYRDMNGFIENIFIDHQESNILWVIFKEIFVVLKMLGSFKNLLV